jgi:hypothetical protein
MGEWTVSPPRPRFSRGKGPTVPIGQEAGWAPEPVWTQRPKQKSFTSAEDRSRSPGRPVRSQTLLTELHNISYHPKFNSSHLSFTLTCQSCLGLYNRPRWSSGNVLATGPKDRGFKPGRGQWIFKGDKIRSTTSFGGEVKPSLPCRKILHVKDPYR